MPNFARLARFVVSLFTIGLCLTLNLTVADAQNTANTVATTDQVKPPKPPLEIAEPAEQPTEFGEHDLSKLEADVLSRSATSHYEDGDFEEAVQLQYWAIKNGVTDSGYYNLACYTALAGNVDDSLHWLQKAAELEGVDPEWAGEDADLKLVRRDPRWKQVAAFLLDYRKYWSSSGVKKTVLILPSNHDASQPIPVLIGLHGLGGTAENLVDISVQDWANELNVAFLGVCGSLPTGPRNFEWAEDFDVDFARIEDALKEVAPKVKPQPGKILLYGFSQGAVVAGEQAVRHPDLFAGAILMSPGGNHFPRISKVEPKPIHKTQGFVCLSGAKEAVGNRVMHRSYVRSFTELGSRLQHHAYADVEDHDLPPDYSEAFPKWVQFIFNEETDKENAPSVEPDQKK